jgi:Histidine kinase-like ATPase domain
LWRSIRLGHDALQDDECYPATEGLLMAAGTTGPTTVATPTKREQVFPARPDQVRIARTFMASVLAGCPVADDAILCVSELAANCCLHSASREAGGTFTVRAEIHDSGYVRIEVEDSGGPWTARAHRDGRAHGLEIVRALATDSGVDGGPLTGWIAWARLDVPAASEPAP